MTKWQYWVHPDTGETSLLPADRALLPSARLDGHKLVREFIAEDLDDAVYRLDRDGHARRGRIEGLREAVAVLQATTAKHTIDWCLVRLADRIAELERQEQTP